MRLNDRVELLPQKVLVGTDDFGNERYEWDWESDDVRIEPALVTPLSSTENVSAQDTITTRWRVVLLPLSSATAKSRVRWRGNVYEVDGDVEMHPDTRSRPHHKEALLVKVAS